MAEQYYGDPRQIQFGNIMVELHTRKLNHGTKRDLRNFFNKYGLDRETGEFEDVDIHAGAIESLVVRRAVKDMIVGGNKVQFTSPQPEDDYPPDIGMGNDPDEKDLYSEVLKTIVDKNRFLAYLYPFNMVFAQYLMLVNMEKQEAEKKRESEGGPKADEYDTDSGVGPDPTESPEDTSSVTRMSGTELIQNLTQNNNDSSS